MKLSKIKPFIKPSVVFFSTDAEPVWIAEQSIKSFKWPANFILHGYFVRSNKNTVFVYIMHILYIILHVKFDVQLEPFALFDSGFSL
jgi:hypothetical protein